MRGSDCSTEKVGIGKALFQQYTMLSPIVTGFFDPSTVFDCITTCLNILVEHIRSTKPVSTKGARGLD